MRWIGPLVTALALLTAAPASAVTITVTGTGDAPGATCPSATSCPTIRAALVAASQFSGPDTILVPAGNHQLVDQGSSVAQLEVFSDVTIRGASARTTRVLGGGTDRVFFVAGSAPNVTISRLTMSGGNELCCNPGGNLYNAGGNVTLDHVRVTGGKAGEGGGIANQDGTMTIQSSLIDGNDLTGNDSSGDGGGILNVGSGSAATLTVRDSTITANIATSEGAGISSRTLSGSSVTTLQRVTVARNQTTNSTGGPGGIEWDGIIGSSFTVSGSIIFGNTTDNDINAPPAPSHLNCSTGSGQPTSGGRNVYGTSECGFAAAGDTLDDPLLGATLVNAGGQTDVLTIPGNSPAINRVPCSGLFDQRDVPRPQGAACDSGAYELNFAPDTSVSSTPGEPGSAPTFTYASSEGGSLFQCRIDGPAGPGVFFSCSPPSTPTGLAPGTYTFVVRAVDALGLADPTPASLAFTVLPPEPEAGESVVVDELSGTIRVKVPGGGYVPLNTLTEIPNGSTVDARKGVVLLSFEPKNGSKVQKATFFSGIFRVKQFKRLLDLKLVEKLAKCKTGQANAAAKKKRRLWGNGKGRFRTSGRYSSATVRGTKWLTQDSCAGTLTRVVRGKVAVRDRVRKKTIIVRKGKKYLARPKR